MSTNCQETPSSTLLNLQYFSTANCEDCLDCGGDVKNAGCVLYTGPNLSCSTINSGDTIELAIQKINDRLCAAAGNYSTYNTFCLPDYQGSPITTQKQFVETISEYVCLFRADYDQFVNIIFDEYKTTVNTNFYNITNPGLTCNVAGVTNTDTLNQILTKYCIKLTDFHNQFNIITNVNWSQCFTILSDPSNLQEAFQTVIDQICATKALVINSQLPLFNNSGSCIGGTTSDTLVTTINALKTAVCLRPTFDKTSLIWGCVPELIGGTTDLQSTIQTILNQISDYRRNKVTWSSDFVVTQTSPGNACAGINVELATPLNIDRFVAATVSDTSPGTLEDKLVAGTNVTLDFTNPSEAVINCTGTDTYKVKAASSESNVEADFLNVKINGTSGNYGTSITTVYNSGTKKLDVTPSIDEEVFWNSLYTYLYTTPTAHQKLCDLISTCPVVSPSFVSWTYENVNISTQPFGNRLEITDVTIPSSPVRIIVQNIETAATTLTCTLNSLFTTPGKVLEVEIFTEENNAYSSLEIIDTTAGITLTSNLNQEVPSNIPNKFTFTIGANKNYTVSARTHPAI